MALFTTVDPAPKGQLSISDLNKMLRNVLVFTAPALALFFASLAAHMDWRASLAAGLYVLYGLLADLFKKLNG